MSPNHDIQDIVKMVADRIGFGLGFVLSICALWALGFTLICFFLAIALHAAQFLASSPWLLITAASASAVLAIVATVGADK